jgi:tetratricopeptide (TPR) repeat protein
MYCKHCGITIADDSTFCSKCGTKQSLNITIDTGKSNIETRKTSQNDVAAKTQVKKNEISFTKPFASQKFRAKNEEKYDNTFQQDSYPIIFGILSILLFWVVIIVGSLIMPEIEIQIYSIYAYIFIGTRIGFTIWCYRIARTLNRNTALWWWFAFLFPAIALIIIGTKKKLLYKKDYQYLSLEKKSIVNDTIAVNFMKNKYFKEAMRLIEISIELNPNNSDAFDTRGRIKYFCEDYSNALEDIHKSIQLNSEKAIKFYHRGYIYYELGDLENANKDWEISAKMGFYDAEIALKENPAKTN